MPKIKIIIAPAGFWPRRPKPEEAPRKSPRIERKISLYQKKSRFLRNGSQTIVQKYAKDCRKFAGGRISMRRILAAESPPRGCFAHTAILLWHTCTVTPNRIQIIIKLLLLKIIIIIIIKNVQNLKRDHVISFRCLA